MKKNLINRIAKHVFRSVVAFSLVASIAHAEAKNNKERPKGPPPEAIEACRDKSEGDSVSFESRRGDTVTGECKLIEDQLVAVPEGHAERKQRPKQQ